ncbi:MAG TPA: acyl-CoA dehydrogenase [Baekduia sp.]|uniref:acyl-CoA dehydrogenase family protein n=1 Tax=Baekduia sp. TaxID=2600305 RepID=UPI002D77DC07|nr:acyl-CoA dehydrogenase [Baekduia sp.]HET6506406.1 acyl-CoA dehydrogenase [Baekduia sp.]
MAATTPDVPPAAPPADVAQLRALLDGEHAEIRNLCRAWLSLPENAPRPDLPLEEHREQVLRWARELADAGETARGFPEEFGGRGQVGGAVAGFETLAFGDLSLLVKCGVQFGLFGGAVLHLGTRRHHEAYLKDITSLRLPGCFAMTEAGHGSNVQALETTATYDDATGEFVVHTPHDGARKDYIGNAARDGRMAAVFAQLVVGGESRGVHALLVPVRDADGTVLPGVRIEDCGAKLGLDGVDNGRIWFDRVRVPRDHLLDRYASVDAGGTYTSPIESSTKRFSTMLGTLIQGRVSVCGASIGATKVALAIAIRHGESRRQFGPPDGEEVVLMDYRTHQRRLLIPLAKTYALHFAQEELVARLHRVFTADADLERERRELETLAAGLKAIATWHATATIQECREACGGMGYLKGHRFAALKADTDVFTTFEGDNTVLLQLAAKNLLTDFRDQLGELDPLGTASFYAKQGYEVVAERSAMREVLTRLADDFLPGRDDQQDLGTRDVQLELLRWRADHVKAGVARRLKGGIDAGRDPLAVLIDVQDHLIAAARAYVECVVLEQCAAAVGRCADPGSRWLLDRVCDLYALSAIEADRGWFQEHGRLSSTRSKAVIKAVNQLCAELRPHAQSLVEAFGVPETALGDAEPVAAARPRH